MERKLATVDEILEVKPAENSDNLDLVRVRGWQVVVKKDDNFKVGDKIVYVEIDSILNPENPDFAFMEKRRFRVKTIKLRGNLSQGVVFPLSILPKGDYNIGDEVSEVLKIVKHIDEVPANLAGKIKGNFPVFIPKTDEERIQNLAPMYENLRRHKWYVSEKLDGSSFTCYLNNGVFGVCSRNIDLLETPENTFWRLARELEIEERLYRTYGKNWALQGELIGNGIQKNKYNLEAHGLRIFNVYDIDNQKYMSMDEAQAIARSLELNFVPILNEDYELPSTMEELLTFAEGKSRLNPNTEREGLVLRNAERTISFKVISNKFLLKNDE